MRPKSMSNAVCRSAPGGIVWSAPNMPLPSSMSFWGSTTAQVASTRSGGSVVSWPVALATSVHLPRHRPVRHRARSLHRSRRLERFARGSRRCAVRSDRIFTEQVTVEPVSDLLDRLSTRQLAGPEVAAHDVVDELAHVPAFARSVLVPLVVGDAGDVFPGLLQGTVVQIGQVECHVPPLRTSGRAAAGHPASTARP